MVASRAGAPARGRDRRDSSLSFPQYGTRFATGASLPPNAPSEDETSTSRPGGDTGHVELVLSDLEWLMRAPPPYVRVSARWWGDDLVSDAARPWVGLDSARDADATFVFPVVAKPSGFARYCRNAAMLALEFADGRTGRFAAVASVDVARLDLGRPVLGARALRTRGGVTVGSVRVAVRVDFLPERVSSFERNEQLAEAETAEIANVVSDSRPSNDERDVDVGDGSVDAEQRRRGGGKVVGETRRAPSSGRDVSPETARCLGAARARSRESAELAARRRAARGEARRGRREAKRRDEAESPRDAIEARELLRREIDESPELDGAEALRVIEEEIAAARPSAGSRNDVDGSRCDAWTRSAISLEALDDLLDFGTRERRESKGRGGRSTAEEKTRGLSSAKRKERLSKSPRRLAGRVGDKNESFIRSSGETTRSARDAATTRLDGTEDVPDGVRADDGDAASCAGEALARALARFSEDKENEDDDDPAPCADAATERCLALAAAAAFTDAQLDDVDGPPPDPDIELRLTLHDGSMRVLNGLDGNGRAGETNEDHSARKTLAVIVKGGHPFPAGELARVALEGVGPRGAGTARVALPSAVADAIVDPAKKTPVMALEVWDPADLPAASASGGGDGGSPAAAAPARRARKADDAADVSFAALFGDFARADPRAVRGVIAVHLDALANDVRRARRRAAENRRWGLATQSDAFVDGVDGVASTPSVSFDGSPLNRVFEVRGVFDGAVNGFLGVEAGVVNDRVRARRR